MQLKWTITVEDEGYTISELLLHKGFSTTQRRKIRRSGVLWCNGKNVPFYWRPRAGDEVLITYRTTKKHEPWDYPLDVRYEDTDYLVINKPGGMLVHATTVERHHTLINAVQAYLDRQGRDGQPHPVHRLDRQTSGLIVIATNPKAQYDYEKYALPEMQRIYTALVQGKFTAPLGSIRFPIARKPGSIIEREVNIRDGKAADTEISVCEANEKFSRLAIILRTGRTHQIRVHCAHLGFPLLGDDLYGGSTDLIQRQALHAGKIIFRHPYTHEVIRVTAPLPDDMQNIIRRVT